jgi:DNA-binding response OmpR family regulator
MQQTRCPVVLAVDDDSEMLNVIRRALKAAGYQVDSALDGAAALARLEQGGVDLVLLDRGLPDMDGLAWCRKVRAREQAGYLPIIMVTGSFTEADRHAGFAAGADDYVTKPFRVEELRDRVGAWMRTHQYLGQVYAQQQEQVAQERAALTVAVETTHDLTRLLMLVLDLLESWEKEVPSVEEAGRLRGQFQDAAQALAARINLLRHRALRDDSPG